MIAKEPNLQSFPGRDLRDRAYGLMHSAALGFWSLALLGILVGPSFEFMRLEVSAILSWTLSTAPSNPPGGNFLREQLSDGEQT